MRAHHLNTADANSVREEIARALVLRKREELGDHLLAAACYASVAHHAAMPYSDVEVVLLTDDEVEAREDRFFAHGIMVECDMLPATRMLVAARRVTAHWGIEADQYRHHLVLWDPSALFSRLWEVATTPPEDAFAPALAASWWWAYELRGKFLNAALLDDRTRMLSGGWELAYAVAMRIALHERTPYESGRTIWSDVVTRGYGMAELIGALTEGDTTRVASSVEDAWRSTWMWGTPPDYAPENT